METPGTEFIHPEDKDNLLYWTKKFGVTMRQLYDAILDTGSLDPRIVKEYLMRDSWLHHPFIHTARMMKNTINYIF